MSAADYERERARVEVEHELVTFGAIVRGRDDMVMRALSTGLVTKHRVSVLTGIARPTIDRIIEGWRPPPPGAPLAPGVVAAYVRGINAVLNQTADATLRPDPDEPYNPAEDAPYNVAREGGEIMSA